MKKQITQVSLVQTAKVVAAIYFTLSLPLLGLLALVAPLFSLPVNVGTYIVLPLAYTLSGFVTTLLGGALYNLVARFTGGIEFVTKEINVETPSY